MNAGYSGPSILDLSHYAVRALETKQAERPQLRINWSREDRDTWAMRLSSREAAAKKVVAVLRQHLPARLAAALCTEVNLPDTANCADITKAQRNSLLNALTGFLLPYTGHQGCGPYTLSVSVFPVRPVCS